MLDFHFPAIAQRCIVFRGVVKEGKYSMQASFENEVFPTSQTRQIFSRGMLEILENTPGVNSFNMANKQKSD